MLRFAFVALIVLFALFVYLLRNLPFWAVLAIIAGLALFFKLFIGRLARALFLMPFKAKGRVLHGASVAVHSVVAAAPPNHQPDSDQDQDDNEEYDFDSDAGRQHDGQPDGSGIVEVLDAQPDGRDYYHVDVTIAPRAPTGAFQHWDLDDLRLISAAGKFNPMDGDEDDESCEIFVVELFEDGEFTESESSKVEGPHRLRLHVGVRPGTGRLKFQYYFETFGEVTIPKSAGAHGPA